MEIILLALNLAITFAVVKRNGGNPNSVASIYLTGCLLSLYTLTSLELTKEMLFFTAMPIESYEDVWTDVYATYTAMNLLSYAISPRILPVQGSPLFLEAATLEQSMFRISVPIEVALFVIFLALCLINVVHFFSMDYETLMSNDLYLTIKTPEAMGIRGDAMAVYHKLIRFIGASAVIVLCESLYQRKHPVTLVSAIYLLYCLLIMATGASRWICVYSALALGYVLIRKPAHNKPLLILLTIVTFFSFLFVLMGRANGAYGLSHLSSYMDAFSFNMIPMYISGVAVNIFEGAFNLANSLKLDSTFDPWYVRHSFMPFFSFMDGFNERVPELAGKFAPNVPMSAISETYLFGPPFFAAYLTMHVTTLRLSISVYQRQTIPFILKMALMAPMYYIVIAQHTYSLRTMVKPTLLMLIVLAMVLAWSKRNSARANLPVAPSNRDQ